MPEITSNSSWWDFLEEAQKSLEQVKELLTDSTLTDEERDDLTSADLDYRKTIRMAKEQLGLTSQ